MIEFSHRLLAAAPPRKNLSGLSSNIFQFENEGGISPLTWFSFDVIENIAYNFVQ